MGTTNSIGTTVVPNRPTNLPGHDDPLRVARVLAKHLPASWAWWRGDYYAWTGAHWAALDEVEVRRWLYEATEHATYGDEKKRWAPNQAKIANLIDALRTAVLLRTGEDEKCLALQNGVLDISTEKLLPHTPDRFNLMSVPFNFDPAAKCPNWLSFLDSVLPGDTQAHELLAEWFGYVLSGRTDRQKMLSLIGPKRCGKGTIARVLQALLGAGAYSSPMLSQLGGNFGEQSLIGKSLAVISDARWSARNDQTERAVQVLLAITGEDERRVERKNRTDWEGKIGARFMCMSNDLPTFRDDSGALASRMMHIQFNVSFYGREDFGLTARLLAELPGILNWAIEGMKRLLKNERFTTPDSAAEVTEEIEHLSSPVKAFLDSGYVTLDANRESTIDEVHIAFGEWALSQGMKHVMEKNKLSSAVRSAAGEHVKSSRPRIDGRRITLFTGLGINKVKPGVLSSITNLDSTWPEVTQPPA